MVTAMFTKYAQKQFSVDSVRVAATADATEMSNRTVKVQVKDIYSMLMGKM